MNRLIIRPPDLELSGMDYPTPLIFDPLVGQEIHWFGFPYFAMGKDTGFLYETIDTYIKDAQNE
jgi:hypothetical protein